MPKALILGGGGQIGRTIAERLVGSDWDVTLAGRMLVANLPAGTRFQVADARDSDSIIRAMSGETTLLVSAVAFDDADAACLATISNRVSRIVVISSASVYRDADSRTLDEAATGGFPDFPIPIRVDHPTVRSGPQTYSTRKIAMEERLFGQADCPVTILRPCAVHGPHSRHPREWWFVKRMLDRRPVIPVLYGDSRFQTTSTRAIADAVLKASTQTENHIWNVGDVDSPSVIEIGRTVAAHLGVAPHFIPMRDREHHRSVGRTPWSIVRSMVVEDTSGNTLGYADTVGPAIDWLAGHVDPTRWRKHLPQLAAYPYDLFDYAEEDRAL